MTISDWIMITSVLMAPLLAVQAQKWIESWKEEKERRKQIFKTIMATRATRLDHKHITALNMVDLEFTNAVVLEKWSEYRDELESASKQPDANASQEEKQSYKSLMSTWISKHNDKFIEPLYAMSRSLGYKSDKVNLKKGIYYPIGLSDLELEQQIFRRAAVSFLSGGHAVRMKVDSLPEANEEEEVKKLQLSLRKYIADLIDGKVVFPISISNAEKKIIQDLESERIDV